MALAPVGKPRPQLPTNKDSRLNGKSKRPRLVKGVLLIQTGAILLVMGCAVPGSGRNGNALGPAGTPAMNQSRYFELDIALAYHEGTNVVYGDPKKFSLPVCIDFDKLLLATPTYQQILSDNLRENSAKYWRLLTKANAHIRMAIREVADQSGYDLFVLCQPEPVPPGELTVRIRCLDITAEVVEEIRSHSTPPDGGRRF